MHFITVGDMYFDDINLGRSYGPFKSYFQSKLGNILFTRELASRLNSNVINKDIFYDNSRNSSRKNDRQEKRK